VNFERKKGAKWAGPAGGRPGKGDREGRPGMGGLGWGDVPRGKVKGLGGGWKVEGTGNKQSSLSLTSGSLDLGGGKRESRG